MKINKRIRIKKQTNKKERKEKRKKIKKENNK